MSLAAPIIAAPATLQSPGMAMGSVPVANASSIVVTRSRSTDHTSYEPPPGHIGNLTSVQQNALENLRHQIQHEGWFVTERMDDAALLRFLRARKFDVLKAKEMLKDTERWRAEFGVDEIIRSFDFKEADEVSNYYPQFYHKTDKDGRPVYIQQLGKLDFKALYKITTQDRLVKHLVFGYENILSERLPSCSRAVGHPVETLCTILDLKDAPLTKFLTAKDYVAAAASIGQNRYPELMGKFFIINAPWTFTTVWALIKPWLDEITVQKIKIIGSNYQEALLEQIPAENLPVTFGGKCRCVCQGGCAASDAGPWSVPSHSSKSCV